MKHSSRLAQSTKVAALHAVASLLVCGLFAAAVFWLWFPHPYERLAGGQELFWLIVGVDAVCGPLLTFVLFNPQKPRRELVVDLSLVIIIQLAALSYGLWTTYFARPLYLVHEVDRFKVIARPDVDASALHAVQSELAPVAWRGPKVVGLREANGEERQRVLFESLKGGRDFGERPEFYVPYSDQTAAKVRRIAKPLSSFLSKYPSLTIEAKKIAGAITLPVESLSYLPVTGREDWIAVIDPSGSVIGFLPGDGF
jgi:hypothetical protein